MNGEQFGQNLRDKDLGMRDKEYTPEEISVINKRAQCGDAEAQCELGVCYLLGKGVERDYERAIKWFYAAAVQGVIAAQYNLGVIFELGLGVAKDEEGALKWFLKAAEQGTAAAQYKLWDFYARRIGVVQNWEEAVKWLSLSAEQNFPKARSLKMFGHYRRFFSMSLLS